MFQVFGLLSGLLPLLGTAPYVRDILRHKTRPHRGSFLIWAILGAIAFFTQLASGATWSLFLPAADTLAVLIIFTLSIPYGMGGLSKQDVAGLAVAVCGLVLWYFTKQPLVALAITIGIDAVGSILTLIKTYAEPETETFSAWLLSTLGGLFAMLAVGKWSFWLLVYPAYILVANGAVTVTIVLRKRSKLL